MILSAIDRAHGIELWDAVVRTIEQILFSRAPRWCRPRGLDPDEVRAISLAIQRAVAHQIEAQR
jgi:hypothetical protein